MNESMKDARHYSLANVDKFWNAGSPIVLPIPGMPPCTLDLYPARGTITLGTAFSPPEPDLAKWRNITFKRVSTDHEDRAELSVKVEDNLHAAYGLLTSVADHLQLHSEPLAVAIALAVTKHREMFAGKVGLSLDKEIGLFGELLVLEYLIGQIGPGPAGTSWQGQLSEEHDFVLDDVHLEVKTTSGERRQHVMHGFTQLVPLRNVPLSVVSLQVTRGNHQSGRTLYQLVSHVRSTSGGFRPKIDACLEEGGWKDEDADLYPVFWTLRNPPRAYDVDDRFPAMTIARLSSVVPNLKVVSDLSYRVDLTHFTPSTLPEPLAGLVSLNEDHV